jgi:hypothetical protein
MVLLLTTMIVAASGVILWRAHRTYHVPGPIEGNNFGFCDFHNGIYFPTLAVSEQISPYGRDYEQAYPVPRPAPMYAPSTFLLHLPLVWIPMEWGENLYFGFTLLLAALIARLAIRCSDLPASAGWILMVMLIVVVSRPGYGTLSSGYFTFELVLGTIVCLHWGNRPWLGGLGYLVAATKPTYAIPLAILMLARGQWRALVVGVLLTFILSAAIVAYVMPGKSVGFLIEDMRYSQSQHLADRPEMPEFSWTRVDAVALVAKWMKTNPGEIAQISWMMLLLVLPVAAMLRLREPPTSPLGGMSGTITLLSMNVTLYQHYYDMAVLIVPFIALVFNPRLWPISRTARAGLALLILIPLMNYLSTNLFFGKLGIRDDSTAFLLLTSINGVCLALALCWLVILALTRPLQTPQHP